MDNWNQEKDFIEWDNATHSNASQRQILDWFKERFKSNVSDADIEAWAETLNIQDLDVELTTWELTERKIGSVIGAKAMRDGLIGKKNVNK